MSIGATWAGTYTFTAPRLVDAGTIAEVQRAVADTDGPIRALGTRHSFTDLADSTGTLVTVTGIDASPEIDAEARTVTVGAGTRYGVLATWLESHGWALHNMGSLPHISVAGAVATGTHGSGVTNGCLSDAVAALEYVNAAGEVVTARRGDADFAALAVGLGAFGIVVRVTLDIQPTYLVRQDVYYGLPWEAALADLRGIMGSAYSVSLFTMWDEPTFQQVWRKARLDRGEASPEMWLDSTRIREEGAVLVDANSSLTAHGTEGPWLERLPHFRLDGTPSNGDEIQTEYFVALDDGAEALRAVRAFGADIAPHLLVTELRTVAADDLWLSGAYGRDALAIHFTWRNEPEAVASLTPRIEAALEPFLPRPHWGKAHTMSAESIARAVPRLGEASDAFATLDPERRFANDHLRRIGVR